MPSRTDVLERRAENAERDVETLQHNVELWKQEEADWKAREATLLADNARLRARLALAGRWTWKRDGDVGGVWYCVERDGSEEVPVWWCHRSAAFCAPEALSLNGAWLLKWERGLVAFSSLDALFAKLSELGLLPEETTDVQA